MEELYFGIDVIKALFTAFVITLIMYEVFKFLFSIIYFYVTDKKGKKWGKFYENYKFLDFSVILLGRLINFSKKKK